MSANNTIAAYPIYLKRSYYGDGNVRRLTISLIGLDKESLELSGIKTASASNVSTTVTKYTLVDNNGRGNRYKNAKISISVPSTGGSAEIFINSKSVATYGAGDVTDFISLKYLLMEVEPLNYDKHREQFISWMFSRVSKRHARDMINYLDKYLKGKGEISLNELLILANSIKNGKRHFMMALRNLIKFYEVFRLMDYVSIAIYRNVIKIPKTGIDMYVPSSDEILENYKKISEEKYRVLYKLLFFSGIRIVEGIEVLSKFNKKNIEIKGNIAKYHLNHLRGTKNVFIVYMPAKFVEELSKFEMTFNSVDKYFRRRKIRLKYLRKWHYNYLVIEKRVPADIADFIQGRFPATVSARHYLAKMYGADEWYSKVADELYEIISKVYEG